MRIILKHPAQSFTSCADSFWLMCAQSMSDQSIDFTIKAGSTRQAAFLQISYTDPNISRYAAIR